ncbi:MAG TPA: serine hydrolase domain-containing protein [Candidatus Saccharimonadales bacterium]|nr:serine hydrolase domain-containing protein [Candidatus Saccharimonadales bacterium]
MRRAALSAFLAVLCAVVCFGGDKKKEEPPKPAQTVEELKTQLEKILKDTHTPGVSVAIVKKDGPEWVGGVGLADVAANRPVTAETLFRIGSTSKAFASMSILLMADRGKLSLDDSVKKLAPEVWFENKWEATDPVRVVNLLEHTTGWDDIHLREYAKDAPGMSLKEGLDYDHHSRTSRWPPGTRMAYCNAGPAVAAYIVEKVSGQRFEDFVSQNLFLPIGMKTATYFQPADPKTMTVLYHEDGKTPFSYWNIIMRPAGAINASAADMAAYVQFYLNRGMVSGVAVLPNANIDRMESPASTWAAKEGLKAGYGLSDYWSFNDGFVYHGHDGGVEGGLTDMSYMPEYAVGYFYSINTGSGDAFDKVGKAIRAYITNKLQKPEVPAPGAMPANAGDYAGWYEPNSPRVEMMVFLERLLGLKHVTFKDGKMYVTNVGGTETFVPVTGTQFRHIPKKNAPPAPVATTMLLAPKDGVLYLQTADGMSTAKKLSTVFAWAEILLTVFVVLSVMAIGIYAPFWILGALSAKRRRPAERGMRWWPLVAVLSLAAFVLIFILNSEDLIEKFGNVTGASVALCLTTIVFALAVLASGIAAWRTPAEGVRPGVLRFSRIVSLGLLIALVYLAFWGMIGLRTWA